MHSCVPSAAAVDDALDMLRAVKRSGPPSSVAGGWYRRRSTFIISEASGANASVATSAAAAGAPGAGGTPGAMAGGAGAAQQQQQQQQPRSGVRFMRTSSSNEPAGGGGGSGGSSQRSGQAPSGGANWRFRTPPPAAAGSVAVAALEEPAAAAAAGASPGVGPKPRLAPSRAMSLASLADVPAALGGGGGAVRRLPGARASFTLGGAPCGSDNLSHVLANLTPPLPQASLPLPLRSVGSLALDSDAGGAVPAGHISGGKARRGSWCPGYSDPHAAAGPPGTVSCPLGAAAGVVHRASTGSNLTSGEAAALQLTRSRSRPLSLVGSPRSPTGASSFGGAPQSPLARAGSGSSPTLAVEAHAPPVVPRLNLPAIHMRSKG